MFRIVTSLAIGLAFAAVVANAPAADGSAREITVAPRVDRAEELALTPEEAADAKQLAADMGWSLEKALAYSLGQSQFLDSVEQLRADPDSGLVAAEWRGGAKSPGLLYLNHLPSAKWTERIAGGGTPVEVRVVDLPTEATTNAFLESAGRTLAAKGYDQAIIHLEPSSGRVTVELPPRTQVGTESGGVATAFEAVGITTLLESTAPGTLQVEVRAVTRPAANGQEYRGGMSYNGCTGGFVVKSGTIYGISTAGHCDWFNLYDGVQFAMTTSQGVMRDLSNRDVKWHQDRGGTPQNYFRASSTEVRNVVSAANPVLGASVCKFGIDTKQTCSTIWKANYCRTSGAGTECGFYSVSSKISDNGDSGGPWYWGSKALGIHSGSYTVDGATRSTCTGIGALSLANAVVYTG